MGTCEITHQGGENDYWNQEASIDWLKRTRTQWKHRL
jgi:uncharacterized protein with von Willebrand factor type A (vWA) domain